MARTRPSHSTTIAVLFVIVIFMMSALASVAHSQEQLCNQLASDRDDILLGAGDRGLWDYEVDAKNAATACEKALLDTSSRARTLYQLGRAYALSGDEKQARRYLYASSDLRYPRAFSRLAQLTNKDEYASSSPEELLKIYDLCREAMRLNDLHGPWCIVGIRVRYIKARVGVNPDETTLEDAIERLQNFAGVGHPSAQYALAMTLLFAKKDRTFATAHGSPRSLLESSAEAGFVGAMEALGIMLTAQSSHDSSYYVGIQWLKKAAKFGDESASRLVMDLCANDSSTLCK